MLSLRDLQKLDDKLPELGNGEDAADGWDCGTKQVWKLYRLRFLHDRSARPDAGASFQKAVS